MDAPLYLLVRMFVDTNLVETSVKAEKKYLVNNPKTTDIDFLNTMLGTIHSRASAAISHISIMMGVTILLITKSSYFPIIRIVMIVEVCLYVVLLLLCLRCVRSLALNDGIVHSNFKKIYDDELIKRFSIQQFINSGLMLVTTGFLVLVILYAIIAHQ